VLDVPAKDDLRRRLGVLRRELDDRRVFERVHDAVAIPWHVDVDAAERRPSLGGDAVGAVEFTERLLREERVDFHLVDGRNDLGLAHQVLEVARAEVRGADGTSVALPAGPAGPAGPGGPAGSWFAAKSLACSDPFLMSLEVISPLRTLLETTALLRS
jgi:hypothetical protein